MNTMKMKLQIATLAAAAMFAVEAQAAGASSSTLVMPTIGASVRPVSSTPSLGVNTTLRTSPSTLTPTYRQSLPSVPSSTSTSGSLTATVPYTGGRVAVGATPSVGNPGNQITVSPTTINVPVRNNQAPQSAYGVMVTIPLR